MLALFFTLISAAYLVIVILVAVGLYKEPVLHQFERYAEADDAFHLLPSLLFGIGMLTLFSGLLLNATIAPHYPPYLFSAVFFLLAYLTFMNRPRMSAHPQLFLFFPRWYVELRDHTTREERRHIAYMWLCLPRSMRLHLNGSDRHFLIWADLVILATVTQTVEDQEATVEPARVYFGRE